MTTPQQPTKRQQYWLSHIQACDQLELSYRAYADQQGFSPRALYDAKNALVRKGFLSPKSKSRFRRVQIKPPASSVAPADSMPSSRCVITLPSGISLEWPVESPSESLVTILSAVSAQS